MTVATRTEVGTSDMGNVFIFARQSPDGETWMVRAGNHTIGTYDSEERAETVARTLCGDDRLLTSYDAEPVDVPVADEAMTEYVAETQAKVSKVARKR